MYTCPNAIECLQKDFEPPIHYIPQVRHANATVRAQNAVKTSSSPPVLSQTRDHLRHRAKHCVQYPLVQYLKKASSTTISVAAFGMVACHLSVPSTGIPVTSETLAKSGKNVVVKANVKNSRRIGCRGMRSPIVAREISEGFQMRVRRALHCPTAVRGLRLQWRDCTRRILG